MPALWSIRYRSRVACRPEFLRWLIEAEDGVAILHPAFRDSTRFFSFFSISPSTWTAVQLWTEIPIELESRTAMTRRSGKQKNYQKQRRNGEINSEIELWSRGHLTIMRSISSLERPSPLFVNSSSEITGREARRRMCRAKQMLDAQREKNTTGK